ncbi:MAG: TldD/PmbA family protein [Leptospiraceae bacterium]|nr:TldD/PmbA family protein [Leptospiraceae bacterium]
MDQQITPEFLEQVIHPLAKRYPFARAFFLETSGLSVTSNLRQTFIEPLPKERGIAISILAHGILYEGSSVVHSKRDVWHTLERLESTIAHHRRHGGMELLPEPALRQSWQLPAKPAISAAQATDHAREIAHRIRERNPHVAMASVRYRQVATREIYVSFQRSLSQELSRFEAIYSAVLKDENTRTTAQIYDGFSRQGSWELMDAHWDLIDAMLHDGERILGAPRLAPGFYDCIFTPSLAGILAHEAFGHGTEADTMRKGRARGTHYLGQKVASEKVSICDSPALAGAAASFYFDHEGEPASETMIVKNGILTQPMADHLSASLMGIKRTPNGRRQSFDHKVYTRMTNTYFLPGEDTLEDMIASIQDGYFIDRATNGMEDPKSWGIQLEALVARRIHNGQLTDEYFSPVIVTGYVPDLLRSISMVSREFAINGLGMCGKGYKEWVKVTDGGPYLKLRARLA